MKQIKQRLYGLYFLVVAVFILLLSFLLQNVVEGTFVKQQQENLGNEIVQLTTYVKDGQPEADLTEENIIVKLSNISEIIDYRITFMDPEGNPIYDSTIPLEELDNLIEAVEIQQVLLGETTGLARRRSVNTDNDQYYIAQGIFDATDELIGILRLSSEVTDFTAIIDQVLVIQLIGTVLLILVIMALSRNWINKISNAMGKMDNVVTDLTNSQYDTRYVGHSYDDIDKLGESINELAVNLDTQSKLLKVNEERTYGLINHLIIGVMLINEERRIQMVNPVMNELLDINLYGKISHLYTDYIRSAELIELIEEAIQKNETMNTEIKIYIPEEKTLDTNVIPVPGETLGEKNYIVLLYDITEIRRLESVRTDFASNVSHELRTPITALKGFSETLLDGAMHDKEMLQEFLEIMLNESGRLDSMVTDILQLSRLEQGQERFSREWIDVEKVVQEVFQILQQKIELKEINYYIEESKQVTIYTNRDHLKQILMNLIANAISYTPEKGTVIVDLEQGVKEAIIQVIDNGIGIPEESQARIFERFYRVDKARSRNSGGTGLGLSIVKWVAESMGGQIELFSEEDVGTTFVVRLPVNNNGGSIES